MCAALPTGEGGVFVEERCKIASAIKHADDENRVIDNFENKSDAAFKPNDAQAWREIVAACATLRENDEILNKLIQTREISVCNNRRTLVVDNPIVKTVEIVPCIRPI